MIGHPDWMRQQIELYGQRVEMLTLAFTWKHKARPKLFTDEPAAGKIEGVMVAFCRPEYVEEGPVDPKLLELAEHGARAWSEWTKGLDPDVAIVRMTVGPEGINVSISKRTPEDEQYLVQRTARQTLRERGIHPVDLRAAGVGPPPPMKAIVGVLLDKATGCIVCAGCGATKKLARMPALNEVVVANPDEEAWVIEHSKCPPPKVNA